MTSVIENLRAAADAGGVRLGGVQPATEAPVGRFVPISFDVEARGSYAALVTFIDKLEERAAALAVSGARISVQGDGADLLLALRVTGYRLPKSGEQAG